MYDEVETGSLTASKSKMSKSDKERKAKHMKREKIRKLKRLINVDSYDNEDVLSVGAADEAVENMLLFMTDPMVKEKLQGTEFKVINNSLVNILGALEKVAKRERKKFKKV